MKIKQLLYMLLIIVLLLSPFAATALAAGEADSASAAGGSTPGSGLWWWIMLGAVVCIAALLIIFRKRIFKRIPKALTVIVIIVLALAAILPATALIFPDSVDTGRSDINMVSFETNGGSDIPAVQIKAGEKLTELPTPMKAESSFTGWYSDEDLSAPFYSDAPITSDITLFASYTPTQTNLKQYDDPGKYIEDCDQSFSFSIVSPDELTAQNLSGYVLATAYLGELPELNVSGSGGVYTVSPVTPYTEGGHYRFELLGEALSFEEESDAVRTLDFHIYKDAVEVVELENDIQYVLWSDIDILGDNTYYVPASLGIAAGDTVCFWNGELGEETQFFNILLAAAPETSGGSLKSLLTVEESQPADVLDELDVHFKDELLISEQINDADLNRLALSAKYSEGTRQMTSILASAVTQSPTFKKLMNDSGSGGTAPSLSTAKPGSSDVILDGEPFVPIEENEETKNYFPIDMLTENFIDDLTVTAYVATAQNENFYNAGPDDWTVLSLTFTYNTTIKDVIDLNIVFTVSECIKSTAQGDAWMEDDEYTIEDFFSSEIIPDMYFDFAINNYSQTDLDLVVLIKSHDASDDDYLDITKELEEMTQPGGESEAASFLEEVLGSKGDDYISLLDVPLITLSYPIIEECPVLQLNINLNFVVKVNFAAGISAHTTLMSAKQVGITGDTREGADSYENTLLGHNRYTFDLYCAGYIGFKAGLKLSMSLSVYGLKGLGEVGVSGEVGAYLDLYGFMHFGISKLWQYSDNKDVTMQGGLYMEIGIYVEIQVFAKSTWFKAKASASLYETKIPLLEVGNRYVLLRFTDESGSVIMNEDQFSLYGSAGLLDAEYVDMKTGKIVTSSDIEDMSEIMPNFTVQFSSPYFEYDDSEYTFNVLKSNFGTQYENFPVVSPETKRLDATVYVYYTGGNLAFSHQQGGDTMKQIDLTWIDPSIDVENYADLDSVKATYVADIDGEQQQIAEKWVLFGSVPGSVDYSAYISGCQFAGYTNDPTQPIFEDTVYTLHLKRYQRLVSYITYHGGSWHFDVYAVYIGEVPVMPESYDDPGDGLGFTGWLGTPGASTCCLGLTNEITAVDYPSSYIYIDENNIVSSWDPSGEYVYLGLDTTAPLQSFSGTYDECRSSYYSMMYQGVPFNKSSQYLYEAQYEGGPFTVELVYPAMSYTYCGQPQNYSESSYSFEVDFNDPVSIARVLSYAGCGLPVWDEDGDGTSDYSTFAELPRATHDITLHAIFELKSYTVTVLNIDDEVDETFKVTSGGLPSIMKTQPEYPDGDDYLFAYWALSKAGGEFTEWNKQSDPGVFADWTIKPVYERAYDVKLDYMGGVYAGNTSETLKLVAGKYYIDELIDYFPLKETDERNTYVFDDWSCGSSFTVSGDMTIKAEYTATPIIYTTEFNTSVGSFKNSDTHASHTGDYDSTQVFIDGFLEQNETLEPVYTTDKVYTFDSWEKISLSGNHDWYEAQWSWSWRNYTVTFNAGDGTFTNGSKTKTLQLPYGTSATLSAVSADIITPEIEGYAYDLTSWKDAADQTYGLSGGFTVHGDIAFTAQYTQGEHILYTVTLSAAGGTFSGGETTLEYSGYYGEATGISVADPTRTSDSIYDYVFDGWSAPLPATFTQTKTIYAQWEQVYRDYTVTFDANGGTFAGGLTSINQAYHYHDTVAPPDDPGKPEDDYYTYEFTGWNPDVVLVTESCTYTATWRASLKAGLPETGIIVTDGIYSEDINCNGALVTGYACELQDYSIPGGGTVQIPVLTIEGDGLTFKGSNSSVYVVFDSACGSVSFDDLSLSGAYPYSAGILVAGEGTSDAVEINIYGNCEIVNTYDRKSAVWSLRPIVLIGRGISPSLSISSVGSNALYSSGLETDSLALAVTAAEGYDPEVSTYAITGEEMGSDQVWHFVDSDVTAQGMGAIEVWGSVVIEGSSNVTLVSASNTKAPLLAFGEDLMGYLRFVNLTGEFNASYLDAGASGPAVQTTTGITFTPDVSDYDLSGAQVTQSSVSFDGMDIYYTFVYDYGSGLVPQPSVYIFPD